MLNRFAVLAAATLLAGGVAFAQSPSDAPADGQAGAPAAAEAAPEGGPPMMGRGNQPMGQMGMGMGMGMGRPDGGGPGWRQGRPGHPGMMRHGMKGHGQGMMRGIAMTKGAVFAFDRGGPGGKILIKCADADSTEACAAAARPILEMMLAAPPVLPAPPAPPKP